MVKLLSRYRKVKTTFRNLRGSNLEVECFKGIYWKVKSFEVNTEWWEFSSCSQYLGSIPIKKVNCRL